MSARNCVIEYMQRHGIEMTLENYIALNWGEGHELTGEDFSDLPEELWPVEEEEE